ncbi:MAG: helix-turn-helix transcriptional regulator [Alphaproteobacteria bacterium]|nr:helix-turn-helix transcriptional regulator [Alphaproteobacteria bacterium]MBF0392098.1 helix-turn-helix transcriptional regulator [Alphaproteobacteria bacterium]
MIDSPGRFGGLIRARRQALGLTQRDLALAVNVGERFIVDLEGGKPTCQLGKALAVARGVGLALTDGEAARAAPTGGADAYPDLPDPGGGA